MGSPHLQLSLSSPIVPTMLHLTHCELPCHWNFTNLKLIQTPTFRIGILYSETLQNTRYMKHKKYNIHELLWLLPNNIPIMIIIVVDENGTIIIFNMGTSELLRIFPYDISIMSALFALSTFIQIIIIIFLFNQSDSSEHRNHNKAHLIIILLKMS